MTTTSTLTERYIAATVRSLPPKTQDDVRAELAASIADDIETRVEAGEDRAEAERAVLTALGDPDALAAGYADRPLQLIGPRHYLTWWRLLKLLWIIVPVCAVVGVIIAQAIAQTPPGEIIGTAFAVGIGTIVHLGFWVTLTFWVIDRSGADTGVRWSLDDLPEPHQTGAGRNELIGSLVFLGLAVGAVLWDQFVGFVFVPGAAFGLEAETAVLPILQPQLCPWWIAGLFAIIALKAILAISVYLKGGWTAGIAVMNTALALAFTVPAILLAVNGELISPVVFEFALRGSADQAEVLRILTVLLVVGLALGGAWDIIDGWRKALRRSAH